MSNKQIKIEYTALENLNPYKGNPKVHDEKQIQQIAKSIERFGFNNPILIDEKLEVIAGHGRLLAARLLKLETVPVVRLIHLSEAEKRAYRIADNKLSENGRWDTDLLKLEFSEIEKLALNLEDELNLDITGFDFKEIDVLLAEDRPNKKADEKLNSVPYVPENEIVSQHGDVWLLGKHKVICGDSLQEETYLRLFEEVKANMVFIDPPYNVKIQGHVCGASQTKHKEFAFGSGEMNEAEFISFLKTSMANTAKYSAENSIHYVCMDWRHIYELLSAARNIYPKMLNMVVWCKKNGGMGSFYRSQHELILVFQNGKGSHINNVELGKHGRYRTNVWYYAGVNSFGSEQKNLKMHPTVKPVELVRDAILDASKRGDIVLDTFLGSGTTLIAAEKAGRVCYGIEYEPLYIDTIIRRYHELTGNWAIHLSSQKSYEQLLQEKLEKINE